MGKRETDVFEPANEAEANAIKMLLEDNGIEARIVSFHDTAFDGIFQAQKGWGRIRIDEKDKEHAKRLIDDWQAAAPTDVGDTQEPQEAAVDDAGVVEKGGKLEARPAPFGGALRVMWRYGGPWLLVASVTLNAYLLFWYEPALRGGTHVERDAEDRIIYVANYRSGQRNAYRYREYDPKGNAISESLDQDGDRRYELHVAYGKDGKVVGRDIDKNADGRTEKSITYGPDGSVQSISLDENADGRYETIKTYHRGELVAVQSDKNNNGVYEKTVYSHRGRKRAAWMDRDEDGRQDQIRLVSGSRSSKTSITDADNDGFPELAQCTGSDGKKIRVSLIACFVYQQP